MPKVPLGLRLDPALVARIDAARGSIPRTQWLEEAAELRLAGTPFRAPVAAGAHLTSAQAKAGVKPIPRSTERKGK